MRKPKSPPSKDDLFDLVRQQDNARFFEVLGKVDSPLVNKKYLHWDDLLHREPPGDFSRKEWWYALKFRRLSLFKLIPLKAAKGDDYFKYLELDPIHEQLHHITQQASGQVQMPEQIVNPDTRDRYYISSLMEEAITSSQLEGAVTTRKVAKEMIRSGRKPRDKSEQMIFNNFATMRRIGELKNQPLTTNLILEIHRLITEKTLDDESVAGRLRTNNDGRIVVADEEGEVYHVPPPCDELEVRLKIMCDFANDRSGDPFIHPVIRSIILHFWLAYDHPFVDGNGRVARALFYWSMLHHGYWLFEFVSISTIILNARAKYPRAFLYTETDDNDLTYFILYHLTVLLRSIKELHSYIRRQSSQLRKLERLLRGLSDLNHRQKALISNALKHSHQTYTFHSHRRSHGISYQTARTDILNLLDRELLQYAGKQGRTQYFSGTPNLEKSLSDLSE